MSCFMYYHLTTLPYEQRDYLRTDVPLRLSVIRCCIINNSWPICMSFLCSRRSSLYNGLYILEFIDSKKTHSQVNIQYRLMDDTSQIAFVYASGCIRSCVLQTYAMLVIRVMLCRQLDLPLSGSAGFVLRTVHHSDIPQVSLINSQVWK